MLVTVCVFKSKIALKTFTLFFRAITMTTCKNYLFNNFFSLSKIEVIKK